MTRVDLSPNQKSGSFAFDSLDDFSLSETLDNQGYIFLDIRGKIILTSSDASQDAAIVVNITMTSHNIDIASTKFDATSSGLTIGNPELKNRSYLRRPCLELAVNVHVTPGVKLSTFSHNTRNLHIEVDHSLDLSVSDKTTLAAVSGHVNSPAHPTKFHSRKTYVRSVSGGIHGSYSLEDVLSCSTNSGGIRISVIPQKAGPVVEPAAFFAESDSGHCDAQFETSNAPEREYTVDVRTGSGGMSGTYIHGTRTRMQSNSGGKRVDIVPFDDRGGELITQGESGSNQVTVRSPLKQSKTLGPLMSTHKSVSGSLRLSYPSQWAGTFEGISVSGGLHADGRGLIVDGKHGGPGMKRVTGRSTLEGEASLSFNSVSGGARLFVE